MKCTGWGGRPVKGKSSLMRIALTNAVICDGGNAFRAARYLPVVGSMLVAVYEELGVRPRNR